MAMDLTGISNEGEFYSQHYLSALMEDDLKGLFKEWKDELGEEKKEPWRLLRGLSVSYHRMRDEFDRERNPKVRLALQRSFARKLLPTLGYEATFQKLDDGDTSLPLSATVNGPSGAPFLWVLEAFDADGENADPLSLPLHPLQTEATDAGLDDLSHVINHNIFFRSEPPRWVLVLGHRHIILLDRSKWAARRALRFDLEEILSRRETTTLRATTALLHKDSLCPDDGIPLLDTLDEKSHKHAYSVSEDLKYALRESVEMLGNEAIYYLKTVRREKVYDTDLAGPLTEECLRYMYRLLFLFYIEARPALGYAPLNADAYRDGYSLEKLRDLEMVRLESERALNGYFLDDSLDKLFRLVFDGFPAAGAAQLGLEGGEHHTFRMPPLKSHLFDPERTPILGTVRLRNHVVQSIIRKMSLAESGGGRGRISYAQLGINQLGAVYEALLSYRGFFAERDLYEVKKKGDKDDKKRVLEQAYFVKAEELDQYDQEEKVFERSGPTKGSLKVYPKGTFIYRLAGRDREKSASYYTPEVLTQCLVKYALKELLEGKTADDILDLTVCEPAMGSAAFLNEAISQLSDAYLERKQRELGEALSPDDFATQKQRVKMYLADNNVYGVDLNPVAVELAEVSLWLNTLVPGGFVPWFGNQLKCGNSLVGARSQVFYPTSLKKSSGDTSWLKSVPEDVVVGQKRPEGSIYHFLLPDSGMAAYNNKVIKGLEPDRIAVIKSWNKRFCSAFTDAEVRRLQRISDSIEKLWLRHISELKRIDARTSDAFEVYGHPKAHDAPPPTSTRDKDRILDQELYSNEVRNSSPYRRLKLVMDYWCALWFWPISSSEDLPTRSEFLSEIELLITGKDAFVEDNEGEQASLFPSTMPKQMALELRDELGFVDIDAALASTPRLQLVEGLSARYRYHHWHLEYADQFAEKGGFDLILGNPPWIQTSWSEGGLMSDSEPRFVIKRLTATEWSKLRKEVLVRPNLFAAYLSEFEEASATQNFLNARSNYAPLEGMKANLYKCFLPISWMITNQNGVSGLLHPEGVYGDPKGGSLRRMIYKRLRRHFQFQNEFSLFEGTNDHGRMRFSINIYGREQEPSFLTISNLFNPPTVDVSFDHEGLGPVPGIKNDMGKWDVSGHSDRIVSIQRSDLETFANLYSKKGAPALETPLPAIHSKQIKDVLQIIATTPRRLEHEELNYMPTTMFDETASQRDNTIKRETRFLNSLDEWVVSGPHFFVGNPCFKTPRRICNENSHYDVIDLTTLTEEYLPRTNYVPACSPKEFQSRIPRVPWGDNERVTDYYRLVTRRMIGPSSERTLIPTIFPPKTTHYDGSFSLIFRDQALLVSCAAFFCSLPFDFIIKSTGKANMGNELAKQLPILTSKASLTNRLLLLVCLTKPYEKLWNSSWDQGDGISWTRSDHRLPSPNQFDSLWSLDCSLRSDFARRQALVEIDVISSIILGLTCNQLLSIYRIQFPVLRQYELDTWYDQHGRIVFSSKKGGIIKRKSISGDFSFGIVSTEGIQKGISLGWEDIKDLKEGVVTKTFMDDTMPGGPVERTVEYHAPFDRCDREEDYRVAWEFFEKRFAEEDE